MSLRATIWCAVSTKAQADDEKDSLPAQERNAVALCEREGWQIVDVLRVPGHSRDYIDFHELARDARQAGIDAFDRLAAHWKAKDFDVLICFDGNRFAREQSVHAYITSYIVQSGMRIYSLSDGWVDQKNYRMWTAMNGYKAATEIDQFVEKTRIGKEKRVERGLPVHAATFSHKIIRDKHNGRAIGLEVDEAYRRFWLDLAELILSEPHLSWHDIGRAMNARGYRRTNGVPYSYTYLRKVLYHPQIWGNTAINFSRRRLGCWAFDPFIPAPEGTVIHYGMINPVYEGELAERVKAELTRRFLEGERRSPYGSRRFSGLIICEVCGCSVCIDGTGNGGEYYRCFTWRKQRLGDGRFTIPSCGNRQSVSAPYVTAWLDSRLQQAITSDDPEMLFQDTKYPLLSLQMEAIQKDITQGNERLNTLINELSYPDLSDRVKQRIHDAIRETDAQLSLLEKRLAELRAQVESDEAITRRHKAFQRIKKAEDFWELPPSEINRLLRDLFGRWKLVVNAGQIVGMGFKNK